MPDEPLKYIEVMPPQPAEAAVIWLHGLGADGYDFEPVVPALGLTDRLPVAFLFPHAPRRPVTVNGGMVMPAWYDILELDLQRRIDREGFAESVARVSALVDRQRENGIPAARILLAGFSQGGAVALHAALCYPQRLGGAIALSTYLADGERLGTDRSDAGAGLPVFMAHGTRDPLVPAAAGRQARDRLREMAHPVEWHEYPMEHEVCGEEIAEIRRFLLGVLDAG